MKKVKLSDWLIVIGCFFAVVAFFSASVNAESYSYKYFNEHWDYNDAWSYENLSYDNSLSTYADAAKNSQYDILQLNSSVKTLYVRGIRIYCAETFRGVFYDADICIEYYDGSWKELYNGSVTKNQWEYFNFSDGHIECEVSMFRICATDLTEGHSLFVYEIQIIHCFDYTPSFVSNPYCGKYSRPSGDGCYGLYPHIRGLCRDVDYNNVSFQLWIKGINNDTWFKEYEIVEGGDAFCVNYDGSYFEKYGVEYTYSINMMDDFIHPCLFSWLNTSYSFTIMPCPLDEGTTCNSCPDILVNNCDKWEYNEQQYSDSIVYSTQLLGQTFTVGCTGDNETLNLCNLELYMKKYGNPTDTAYVYIEGTTGVHNLPDGNVLSIGTFNPANLTTSFVWKSIDMSYYAFSSEETYIVYVHYWQGDIDNNIRWGWDSYDNEPYSDGQYYISQNNGSNWGYESLYDFDFRIYGQKNNICDCWEMVSLDYSKNISKYNSSDFYFYNSSIALVEKSWNYSVSNSIIYDGLFWWNSTGQDYDNLTIFESLKGYWIYFYDKNWTIGSNYSCTGDIDESMFDTAVVNLTLNNDSWVNVNWSSWFNDSVVDTLETVLTVESQFINSTGGGCYGIVWINGSNFNLTWNISIDKSNDSNTTNFTINDDNWLDIASLDFSPSMMIFSIWAFLFYLWHKSESDEMTMLLALLLVPYTVLIPILVLSSYTTNVFFTLIFIGITLVIGGYTLDLKYDFRRK